MDTRKELERQVVATNTCLRDVVETMPLTILLRNCHPLYRSDFALRLMREGKYAPKKAVEFVKLPGYVPY